MICSLFSELVLQVLASEVSLIVLKMPYFCLWSVTCTSDMYYKIPLYSNLLCIFIFVSSCCGMKAFLKQHSVHVFDFLTHTSQPWTVKNHRAMFSCFHLTWRYWDFEERFSCDRNVSLSNSLRGNSLINVTFLSLIFFNLWLNCLIQQYSLVILSLNYFCCYVHTHI